MTSFAIVIAKKLSELPEIMEQPLILKQAS